MPNMDNSDTFELAKQMKERCAHTHRVVDSLLEIGHGGITKEDLSGIDYVFSWLGNADLCWQLSS